MPAELPPEEDRPGAPIAPPLLFAIPIAALFAVEWFFPTSFVGGPLRWILGALIFVAEIVLNVGGFVTQKRAGTDPIPFNPSTRIVAHGLYRFTRNPMYVHFALWTLGLALLVDSVWMLLAVQSPSSSSIASSSRPKNIISSASSATKISTINGECGAGSSGR